MQASSAVRLFRVGAPATLIFSLIFVLFGAACGGVGEDELLVFAAASLTDALTELGAQYEAESGTKILFSFGGSQLLARQITEGAPADLMISAGRQPIDLLAEKGMVVGDPFDLLGNDLVVVVRPGLPNPPKTLEDLSSDAIKRLSVVDPDLAPAGTYAKEALTSLGLWDDLSDKLIPAPDVRAALTNVQRGSADAGIVYRTDAVLTTDLLTLDIVPPDSHSPIVYPVAVTARSKRPEAAQRFAMFLAGPVAERVFVRFGFAPAARSLGR